MFFDSGFRVFEVTGPTFIEGNFIIFHSGQTVFGPRFERGTPNKKLYTTVRCSVKMYE
jgi:hypothetical protein